MEEILSLVASEGVVVVAFVYLLKYTLDTAIQRENKLMDFMNTLKDEIKNLRQDTTKISSDIEDLKDEIRNNKKGE